MHADFPQYDLVATILNKSTENDKNCHWVDVQNSRKTRFCNIPKNVQIILPSNGQDKNVQALLDVRFFHIFSDSTPYGKKGWFCDNLLKQSVDYSHAFSSPQISKLMDWKEDKMWVRLGCMNDVCFRTDHGGYEWVPQPWKEPRKHRDCPLPNIMSNEFETPAPDFIPQKPPPPKGGQGSAE